jgi:hypothetical protein
MEDKQFKWEKQRELLKQAIRVENGYGNYSALLLPNGRYVILDRTNFEFFVPFSDLFYTLPEDWALWVKQGFIAITLPISHYESIYYIFSIQDKRLIIKGKGIKADAFLEGASDYFIVINEDLKYAIFDRSGNQVSDWHDHIYQNGLVKGKSDYYIVEKDNKLAIFHKDGHQATDWFDRIYANGLVKGDSDYYIAKKDNRYAIFHRDGHQISDWYEEIHAYGLIDGESDYYIVKKDWKEAIFHKDGRQISGWFHKIYPDGLVKGESDYYVVVSYINIFREHLDICKLGFSKSYGPVFSIKEFGFIKDPSENTITFETFDFSQKTLTKQELDDFFENQELKYGR